MATGTENYGQRLYGFSQPRERERIGLISGVFDPHTRRRISDLAPQPGWRCLDVGAGAGSVARWLADQVGDTGQVVALDRDTSLLRDITHPRLTLWHVDVAAPDVAPDAAFDLIHARLVVCHLPERERVLPRLVSWLKPGGWLLISDSANLGFSTSAHVGVRRTAAAYDEVIAATLGSDLNYARRYPRPLLDLGLIDLGVAADVPVIQPGTSSGRFWELTFDTMRAEITASGHIDEKGFDDALAYLRAPDTWELSYALISAWGRRPPG
jgi:SAM-dependent methyltransferase